MRINFSTKTNTIILMAIQVILNICLLIYCIDSPFALPRWILAAAFLILIAIVLFGGIKSLTSNGRLRQSLEEKSVQIREQSHKMIEMQSSVIEEMATLIEDRDANTGEHVKNTKFYSVLIAKEMRERGLHPEEIDRHFIRMLGYAAPLHDVGKISVPDAILLSPKRLTEIEYEQMKTHTIIGAAIIRRMFREYDKEMVQMSAEVAQYHHERWDGGGYPVGLSGEDIPLCARILAVADCFDALVSKRVYKSAMPPEQAFSLIESEAGTHFDPEITEVFLSQKEKVLEHLKELEEKSSGFSLGR